MKKIYLNHIIENYPFDRMDKEITNCVVRQWNALVYNENQILCRQEINTNNLPSQLTIMDYSPNANSITATILRNSNNIYEQLHLLKNNCRNKHELVLEKYYNQQNKLVSINSFRSEIPNGSTKYKYDINENLIGEYEYSVDNSILTDKKIYKYDGNSNLVKISEFSDNSSGAGPQFLVEENSFQYSSDDILISSNNNTMYSITKLNNGHIEIITESQHNQVKHLSKKVYNERADLVSSVYNDNLTYEFKRTYNKEGEVIELQCYKNSQLEYILKNEIQRNPTANTV